MNRLSVLYVDDDRSNLLAMQYALGDALDLQIAENGDRALELGEGVDVLVADQRMPGMSGVEVCRRFRELHPRAARILYTAYADATAGVAAINEGGVARLLVKPVLNEDLLAAILESWESHEPCQEQLASIAASAATRSRMAIEQTLARSMSPLMRALYDHADDRAAELALRRRVVSLQAGATMSPFALDALRATGIPVVGNACAAIDLDSLLHAMILLEPERIELEQTDDEVRVVVHTDSVARDTMRVASAVLERGGAHVVARDGDLILTTQRERDSVIGVRVPTLRAPSVDVLIVGEHAAYRESFGDLSVAWTDAPGALRRVHDARVIIVDERRHDPSLCRELRARGASSLVLRAGELDFPRHRTLAGVIDRLIHEGQSPDERRAIVSECVFDAHHREAERAAHMEHVRSTVGSALTHARELQASLTAATEPLLTNRELRETWSSCEARAWPST